MRKLHELPIGDATVRNGTLREDGRMVHEMYVYEVKKPSESKYPWDYYTIVKTIPAAEAFPSFEAKKCPLVKK